MNEIKWCCAPFRNAFDAKGQRGLSIIVARNFQGNLRFFCQHRAIEHGEQPPPSTKPLATVSESLIEYCPWCGRELGKWYRRNLDAMVTSGFKISAV